MVAIYDNFTTTQTKPASRLVEIVQHHARTTYLKPIMVHQIQALELVRKFVRQAPKPIIIDSGCGTGLSTINLARIFPGHWVIGIDKSLKRLKRIPANKPSNALIVRADLIDMWRLLASEQLPITHHFLFFPNPWPKAVHLKRRFHAHPVFATMARLAPHFELRTNWRIYADECALAMNTLGYNTSLEIKSDLSYMTLFEKKYLESGCAIFVVKSHPLSSASMSCDGKGLVHERIKGLL